MRIYFSTPDFLFSLFSKSSIHSSKLKISAVLLFFCRIACCFIYKRYEGPECLEGQSVGTLQAPSVAQCMFACERTDLCTAFTYFDTNMTCNLKKPVAKKTVKAAASNIVGCKFFYRVLLFNIN